MTYLESLEKSERSRKKAILEGHEAAQNETAVLCLVILSAGGIRQETRSLSGRLFYEGDPTGRTVVSLYRLPLSPENKKLVFCCAGLMSIRCSDFASPHRGE